MAMGTLALGRYGREPATRDSHNLRPQLNESKGFGRAIKIRRYFAIKLAMVLDPVPLGTTCCGEVGIRETGRAVMIWPPG